VKLLVVAITAVAVSVAFWDGLAPGVDVEQRATITDGPVRTSYVVDGTRRRFSDEGRPTDTLKIHSATRWLNSDQTALGGIQYVTDGNSGEIWNIRASDGVFFEDTNELALTNGVVIDEHAQQARMTTEAMRLLMDQKLATGEHKVVLTGRGSRTTGSAFRVDLRTNKATLIGDVQTNYE